MKQDRTSICFLPRFAPQEQGGVAEHVRTLSRELTKRGWPIVDKPDETTIIHAHAMARFDPVHVYTNHGIYPMREHMPSWQRNANIAIFDNLKLAEQVIAVSRWTAQHWEQLTGRTAHIIYNGIDVAAWQDIPRGYWRGRLGVSEKIPLVLWGKTSLSDVLDPTPLIELAIRQPNWIFVAPLPPNSLPTLIRNLICVGKLSFEHMRLLIGDCDVYLATVAENHSIQLLEALAAAKPILGYNWAGTAETLVVNDTVVGGQLVPPDDLKALAQALPAVYDQRAALGAAGRAHVAAHFALTQQIEALEQVYAMTTPMERRKRNAGPYMQPKCSIIIPVYNKEAWIADTIRSALHQLNAPKYEVIVVNDGSTDGSLIAARHALAEAQGSDRHLTTNIYDIPNGGVSAARNFGISQAKGEYICCLDADDLIDPHFLQRLSAALDADPGLGIAYSDFIVFGTDQRGMPFESQITCDEYDFEKLKRGNIMPCCNLFRKVAWQRAGGYKPINPSWEDYELWLNMGKLGWYGRRVAGMYFRYRKVPKTGRDYQSQGLEWKLRATVNAYHRDLYPPLVSFVIPCYQHSQFLGTALDAVAAQTFPDWEVVVVDDGNAPEEAAQIAQLVEQRASQSVRLVRHAENFGLAIARNTGVDAARGTWIVPLDADDTIAPTYLEKTLRASEFNPKRFVYTDTYLWWPQEQPVRQEELKAHDYDFDEALNRITWSCTILFTKQAWQEVGGYKAQMSQAGGWEDWEFAVSLGEIGVCGVHVEEPLFYYRQYSNNQMRHHAEQNKGELQETLRRLHAAVYRGERPAMCCGAGKKTRAAAAAAPAAPAVAERAMPPVVQALAVNSAPVPIVIRYVGSRAGTQTWQGPSGQRYRFGLSAPMQKVDPRDVSFFLDTGQFQKVTA